jgi:hypothetical protein
MSDIIQEGIAFLNGVLKTTASQLVTYARGYDSVDVLATFGSKLLAISDDEGNIRMEWTDMDFSIACADLDFGNGTIKPQRGDIVYVTTTGNIQIFEVMPYGNEPAWKYYDPFQIRYLIHAKFVGVEPYS